jgi:hypothetical protein
MMKVIFVVLCLAALILAHDTDVEDRHDGGVTILGLNPTLLVQCIISMLANIVGGLLRIIIGLVITLSGLLQIVLGTVVTLTLVAAYLTLDIVSGTVEDICHSMLNITFVAVIEHSLQDLFSESLLVGLVQALLALPLAALVAVTTLTNAIAWNGCFVGLSMSFPSPLST